MEDSTDLEAWLALSLVPEVGGATIRKLLGAFGSPEAVLRASPTALGRVVDARFVSAITKGADKDSIARSLQWASDASHHVVTLGDPAYPQMLLQISDPPALAYVAGRLELLQRTAIAIVGSRNPTPQGVLNAREFAKAVSAREITVVSGLALGIDAAAHEGALAAAGSTIAVLGTGVDIKYPRRNERLYDEILARGVLVSELPLGSAPQPSNFPRRNRLISGLARGCLVVEAALSSGSLITARLALEQGREVFAIPGSIHSPLSKGCHALIKQGAKLVESTTDLIEELGFASAPASRAVREPLEGTTRQVLDAIGFDPIDIDSLCRRSGLTPDIVSAILLELELSKRVAALPGGRYARTD